jgi:hypothetical protein
MTRMPVLLAQEVSSSDLSRTHWKAVTGCAALSGSIFALDCMTPLGVADGMLYPIVVLLASLSCRCAVIAMFAALGSALILVGWILSPSGGAEGIVAINRIMAVAAIWIVAVALIVRMRFVADAAVAQRDVEAIQGKLMILHGLATVCCGCKRVRSRDGRWQELSTYCQEQSDAELSCGVCDRCAQNHWWHALLGARQRRASRT